MAQETIAGAEYLVSIFGTEKDRVNCPFYYKIGACRHGDKCTRRHNKPSLSQTIMLVNFYQNPLTKPNYNTLNPKQLEEDFEDFYIDVFDEFSKHGYVEELHICDNISDHMVGNVYVQFANEEDSMRAMQALTGRFFGGRPVVAEYSPVTDFREASCRQYEHNECTRGGYCNFLHLKPLRPEIKRALFRSQKRDPKRRERSRSRSKERRRERSRSKSRERKRRSRSREREEKRQRRGSSRERRDDRRDDRRPREDNRSDPRMEQRDPRGDPREQRDPRLEQRDSRDPRDPRQQQQQPVNNGNPNGNWQQ